MRTVNGVLYASVVVCVGLALMALLYQAGDRFTAGSRAPFLTDVTMHIPDHAVGENPMVELRRKAPPRLPSGAEHVAMFSSIILVEGDDVAINQCSTVSHQFYSGDRTDNPVRFEVYWGMPRCRLDPGRYQMDTCWRPLDLDRQPTCVSSNVFTVTARPDAKK